MAHVIHGNCDKRKSSAASSSSSFYSSACSAATVLNATASWLCPQCQSKYSRQARASIATDTRYKAAAAAAKFNSAGNTADTIFAAIATHLYSAQFEDYATTVSVRTQLRLQETGMLQIGLLAEQGMIISLSVFNMFLEQGLRAVCMCAAHVFPSQDCASHNRALERAIVISISDIKSNSWLHLACLHSGVNLTIKHKAAWDYDM